MTTFLIPALLLLAPTAGTGGTGGEEADAPGFSLKSLAQTDMIDSMRVGGLLRASFDSMDDDLSAVPGEDVRGLRFEAMQLWFSAEAFGYDVFIKFDAGTATAFPPIPAKSPGNIDDGLSSFDLRDAWIRKALTEGLNVYVGQYKCPLFMSSAVDDGKLAMIDRTRIGFLFGSPGAYQPGVAATYDIGPFHAKLSVQNGADNATDGLGIVARGEVKLGQGAKQREGALGSEGLNGTFGVGFFKDDSEDAQGDEFGTGIGVDAYTTFNRISFHAEVLDADKELAANALGNVDLLGNPTNDATPWDATAGFLLTEKIEAFARYQSLDNDVDAKIAGAGVNYYVADHKAKWQLNASKYDDDNIDGLILQLGFSIGEGGRY